MSEEIECTRLNLDLALAREAAEILGTEGIADTVHAALRAVVNRHKVQQVLDYDFPRLTLESLEEVRGLRVTDSFENFAGHGAIDPLTPL